MPYHPSPTTIYQPPVVGLLGGSFNPAHNGHIHISIEARKHLNLQAIWWMVTPQNPLKDPAGIADFTTRINHARQLAAHIPYIKITDIEKRLGTRYTVETLKKLKRRFPRTRFVWLMGADNLASIHRWEQWQEIFRLCPILVLDRAPFSYQSLGSKAARRFARFKRSERELGKLAAMTPPAWGFVHIRRHPDSATELRKMLGKKAFLGHNEK